MDAMEGEINAGMGGMGWWDGAAGLPLDVFGLVLSRGCFGKR